MVLWYSCNICWLGEKVDLSAFIEADTGTGVVNGSQVNPKHYRDIELSIKWQNSCLEAFCLVSFGDHCTREITWRNFRSDSQITGHHSFLAENFSRTIVIWVKTSNFLVFYLIIILLFPFIKKNTKLLFTGSKGICCNFGIHIWMVLSIQQPSKCSNIFRGSTSTCQQGLSWALRWFVIQWRRQIHRYRM